MKQSSGSGETSGKKPLSGMIWWAYLITAVLAVPSVGFLVTKMLPVSGSLQLMIFVLACWSCTYAGMRLMGNPRMSPPNDSSDAS